MSVVYEWDNEVQERDWTGFTFEHHHDHHDTAKGLVETLNKHFLGSNNKSGEGHFSTPVLVRDVFDRHDCLVDRQWAYLVKNDSGKWELPLFFKNGCDIEGAKVPKYLKDELRESQS